MNGLVDLSSFLCSGAIIALSPQEVFVGWGKKQFFSSVDSISNQPAFFVSDFFLRTKNPWVAYEKVVLLDKESLLHCLEQFNAQAKLQEEGLLFAPQFEPKENALEWKIERENLFEEAFDQLQLSFRKGHLQKAVPYLFASTSSCMNKKRLALSLSKALQSQKEGLNYVYGYWEETEGFLGLTPETLFSLTSLEPPIIETMALAGTASERLEHFLSDTKECLEHSLVVDYIEKALEPFGRVSKKEKRLLSFNHLTHFKTPIEVALFADFSFEALLLALHPTPALGALPIEAGRDWLKQFDQLQPRGRFGAPFGFQWQQKKIANCLVAIRNVAWSAKGLRIGAGCGVLSGSVLQKEKSEIRRKIKVTQEVLGL